MKVVVQRFGLEDIEKLIDVCQKFHREHPTEMWLVYDAETNSLKSKYSYEGRYDKDEELLPDEEFDKWFEEVKESQEQIVVLDFNHPLICPLSSRQVKYLKKCLFLKVSRTK